MIEEIEWNFGCLKPLPDEYVVVWFECNEMYHWVFDWRGPNERESVAFCSPYLARRSAFVVADAA